MTNLAFTGDVAFSKYFKGSTNRPELIDDAVGLDYFLSPWKQSSLKKVIQYLQS